MNKLFKGGKKVVKIDDKYYLVTDGYHGVCLTFHEPRERLKKNSTEEETYEFEEKWYFTMVGQAIEKYVELSQNKFEDLTDIVTSTRRILDVMEEFKTNYKNW